MKYPIFILTFLCLQVSLAQQIQGIVFDRQTLKPIETASIYFDNTTIGTTTDVDGEFSLPYNSSINSPIIISYLGYETITLSEVETDVLLKIYISPNALHLDEVVINPDDDWTREEKLVEFRKHFLGETKNGKLSNILNEDDILLYYSKKSKQLRAVSHSPIVVINSNLRYKINVNLKEFEVNYASVSKNKERKNLSSVYYAGSNFFQSLDKKPAEITIAKRQETYKGSVLHFMRSLAKNQLRKDGYKIFKGKFSVNARKHLQVIPIESSKAVDVKIKKMLGISYNGEKHSSIHSSVSTFRIDEYGNHTPIDKVRFGGDFGKQRMGDALPLDYLPTE